MSKIIAFCGKKGSGKTTACNYLAGIHLTAAGIIPDFVGKQDSNIYNYNDELIECNKIDQNVVRLYNFADSLKNFAVDVLGLDAKLVWGTQKDKEELTHINWESVPGIITNQLLYNVSQRVWQRRMTANYGFKCDVSSIFYHEPGPMTVREVLQIFGTNICRRLYNNCWVSATMKQINNDNPEVALIADGRFDNEAEAVKQANGFCVLLRRNESGSDSHASENGFQSFKDWDTIIDNRKTSYREFYPLLIQSLSPQHINVKFT